MYMYKAVCSNTAFVTFYLGLQNNLSMCSVSYSIYEFQEIIGPTFKTISVKKKAWALISTRRMLLITLYSFIKNKLIFSQSNGVHVILLLVRVGTVQRAQ